MSRVLLCLAAAAASLLAFSCGDGTVTSADSLIRITNAGEPLRMNVGETFQLEVVQFSRREDRFGEFTDRVNVTPLLRYASSDENVARVSDRGLISAVSPGTTTIEAKISRTLARDDIDRVTVHVAAPGNAPPPLASDYRFPDRIEITWPEPPSGVNQIRLFRSTEPSAPSPDLLQNFSASRTSFIDRAVDPDETYFYSLTFVYPNGETGRSPADSGIAGTLPED